MLSLKVPVYRQMAAYKEQVSPGRWIAEQTLTVLRYPQWRAAILHARRDPAWRFSDFLIIGAQKSGTSWLRVTLANHPEIDFPSDPFELHFFDRNYHRGLKWYLKQFEAISDSVMGDKTPAYALLPENRIRLLLRAAPKIKIIYIVRNPIDRAWSQARMYFFRRLGHDPKHVEAIEGEIATFFRTEFCLARSDYLATMDRWAKHTPASQFKLLFYDDLVQDVNIVGDEVASFLHVDRNVDWTTLQPQRQPQLGMDVELTPRLKQTLAEEYTERIDAMIGRWGDRVAHWRNSLISSD